MGVVFLFWLILGLVCDAFFRKCFNWMAISGGVCAILSISIYPDSHPVSINFIDSFLGSGAAFFVLLVFYKIKMMGAGDVKFAAILGLWVGWKLLLPIWALSCLFAVLHGVVVRSDLKYFFAPAVMWRDGSEEKGGRFIPYVAYLSTATVIVLMLSK